MCQKTHIFFWTSHSSMVSRTASGNPQGGFWIRKHTKTDAQTCIFCEFPVYALSLMEGALQKIRALHQQHIHDVRFIVRCYVYSYLCLGWGETYVECLQDASQMTLRCLPVVSQMLRRCLDSRIPT